MIDAPLEVAALSPNPLYLDITRALNELRAAQSYKDLKARYPAAQFATTHIAKCEQALLTAIQQLS